MSRSRAVRASCDLESGKPPAALPRQRVETERDQLLELREVVARGRVDREAQRLIPVAEPHDMVARLEIGPALGRRAAT